MQHLKISEGEYRLACIVWDHEPVPSGKLVERGVLKNENATVAALIPKDDILRRESRDVVERTFGGSLPAFLTSFMNGRTLSNQEADELKALIDQYREGNSQN